MTALEIIRDQLQLEKAAFGYTYGGEKTDSWATDQLAEQIANAGVRDIRDIAHYHAPVWIDSVFGTNADGSPIMGKAQQETNFYYDALRGVQLKGFGHLDPDADAEFFTSVSSTEYRVDFSIKYTAGGVPYFVPKVWPLDHGTFLGGLVETAMPLMPIILIAANFLVPGLPGLIGNAILGPMGVATSQLTASIVGRVALATFVNGGDVGGAVKGALLSTLTGGIGGQVGDFVQSAGGADFIAKAASVATSSALAGGDPKQAVALSLAQSGVSKMDDFSNDLFPSSAETPLAPNIQIESGFFDPVSSSTGDFSRMDRTDPSLDPANDAGMVDIGSQIPIYGGPNLPPMSPSDGGTAAGTSGGWDWNATINAVGNLAVAALKVNQAYQAAGHPAVQTGRTTATGSQIPQSNGTIVTRTPSGSQTVRQMPVGVPYVTPEGSMVVNNGDGTYTTISAGGLSSTNRYPVNSAMGSFGVDGQKALLVGGGILLALVALSRRRN